MQIQYLEVQLNAANNKATFNGRQFQDSLMKWMDLSDGYQKFLQDFYDSEGVIGKALHDGYFNKNEDFVSPKYKYVNGFNGFLTKINRPITLNLKWLKKFLWGMGLN